MLILLKLTSFAIWFIIMMFIIAAVFHRKRSSIRGFAPYLFNKAKNESNLCGEREEI